MNNLIDYFWQIQDFFKGPNFQQFLLWAQLVSFAICVFLIVAIIILLSRSNATWWIRERIDSFKNAKLPQHLENRWQKIRDRLEKGDEASLKLGVIEADNFFDEILKRMGLPGQDMGERLEQLSKQQLKSLDGLWDAHRLRNLIVHQADIVISREQAERTIGDFEDVLKELEVL